MLLLTILIIKLNFNSDFNYLPLNLNNRNQLKKNLFFEIIYKINIKKINLFGHF